MAQIWFKASFPPFNSKMTRFMCVNEYKKDRLKLRNDPAHGQCVRLTSYSKFNLVELPRSWLEGQIKFQKLLEKFTS